MRRRRPLRRREPLGLAADDLPGKLSDSPAHALGAYPGRNGTVRYEEGLLVGYRWFDAKGIDRSSRSATALSYTRSSTRT